jgi:pimeloyl-ACP methyl ester carboxylesterase
LNAAATEIVGQVKQGGATLPLVLKRVDRPPAPRRRPQAPKQPFPYDEEAVTFKNPAARASFAGTLTRPRSGGRHPAVLLISGSGQQDRDETIAGHRPFLVIADFLTRRGIAVLRVDDRGVGGSTGDVLQATTEDFAGDALAAVAYLKSRPDIDPRRIGLVGHSEGGLIAPMVAVQSPDVAFIVLLAGPGVPGDQILRWQMAAIQKQAGVPPLAAAINGGVQALVLAAVKRDAERGAGQRPADDEPTRAPSATAENDKPKLAASATGESPDLAAIVAKGIGSPWLRFFVAYDPRPTLKKVRCPVLAIIGEKDIQVAASQNLPEIESALRAGGNTKFTVRQLPHLNHLFQTCRTGNIDEYAKIEETFAPSALELLGDWIQQQVASKP